MAEVIIPDLDATVSTEVLVKRRQTTQYIATNPTDVTIVRSETVPDGAGGTRRSNPTPLLPQRVRIIQSDESEGVERRNSDGEIVRPTLNMLAEWDADIKVGDMFDWNNFTCEVVYVTDMGYELTCEVSVRYKAS